MSTVDSNMPYMTFSEFSENGWGSFSKSRWTRPIDPTGSRCLQDLNSSLSGSTHPNSAFEHALRVTYRAWFLKKKCNLSGHLGAARVLQCLGYVPYKCFSASPRDLPRRSTSFYHAPVHVGHMTPTWFSVSRKVSISRFRYI